MHMQGRRQSVRERERELVVIFSLGVWHIWKGGSLVFTPSVAQGPPLPNPIPPNRRDDLILSSCHLCSWFSFTESPHLLQYIITPMKTKILPSLPLNPQQLTQCLALICALLPSPLHSVRPRIMCPAFGCSCADLASFWAWLFYPMASVPVVGTTLPWEEPKKGEGLPRGWMGL